MHIEFELAKTNRVIASDANHALILMWKALAEGWRPPVVTEAQYKALRHSAPSPLQGWAGTALSFGGKWFGGWARDGTDRDYHKNALNSISGIPPAVWINIELLTADARAFSGSNYLMYLDPPYRATTANGYAAKMDFDFWTWVDSLYCPCVISEYENPLGLELLTAKPRRLEQLAKDLRPDLLLYKEPRP
jgi:DNA adenine methylase